MKSNNTARRGRKALYGDRMQTVTIPLPSALRDRATALANAENLPRTQLLRLALHYGLNFLEGRPSVEVPNV